MPVSSHRDASATAPPRRGGDIRFAIAYEFKSIMLQLLVGGVFEQAFRKFAEAFELRAVQVYGARA